MTFTCIFFFVVYFGVMNQGANSVFGFKKIENFISKIGETNGNTCTKQKKYPKE